MEPSPSSSPSAAAAAAAAAPPTVPVAPPTTLPPTLAELKHTTLRVTPAGTPAEPFDITLARVARPELQTTVAKQCDLWAWVWTAGSVAADIVAALPAAASGFPRRHDGAALTMLEIGAGSGVASLAGLTAGAHVWASDLVPDALALLRHNVTAAGIAAHLSTSPLDWNAAPAATAALLSGWLPDGGFPDVVVAADVLYMSTAVPAVWRTLQAALQRGGAGTVALVVDPGRPSREAFEDAAVDSGCVILHRIDYASLPTPVAVMRVATVFIITAAADGSELAAARVAALLTAARALQARCLPPGGGGGDGIGGGGGGGTGGGTGGGGSGGGIVPATASAFGYTLK